VLDGRRVSVKRADGKTFVLDELNFERCHVGLARGAVEIPAQQSIEFRVL
jgi:hypothetical protein